VRVREQGRIVRCACVVASAVNGEGYREILGLDTFTSEDEAAWRTFLSDLTARGLAGVQLVVSQRRTLPGGQTSPGYMVRDRSQA
jgi:transposase-like protein